MIPEKDRIVACEDASCDFVPCLEKRVDNARAALAAANELTAMAQAFRVFADAASALRAARAADARWESEVRAY